jgi:hypothetical protein
MAYFHDWKKWLWGAGWPGSDVLIFEIFSPKNLAKKIHFWLQTKLILQILIITLVYEKNANFFKGNCRKSQKILITTSTKDWAIFRELDDCLLWTVFRTIQKTPNKCWYIFLDKSYVLILGEHCVWPHFGPFFPKPIWSPCWGVTLVTHKWPLFATFPFSSFCACLRLQSCQIFNTMYQNGRNLLNDHKITKWL